MWYDYILSTRQLITISQIPTEKSLLARRKLTSWEEFSSSIDNEFDKVSASILLILKMLKRF